MFKKFKIFQNTSLLSGVGALPIAVADIGNYNMALPYPDEMFGINYLTIVFFVLLIMLFAFLWINERRRSKFAKNVSELVYSELVVRFCICDIDGRILSMHSDSLEARGNKKIKTISQLPNIDHELIMECIQKTFATGEVVEHVFENIKRKAVFQKVENSLFKVPVVVWSSIDISEKIALQNKIKYDTERDAMIFKSLYEGLIVTDSHGNIIIHNQVAAKITGISENVAKQMRYNKVFRVLSLYSNELIIEPFELCLASGYDTTFENDMILQGTNGKHYRLFCHISPVRLANGAIVGMSITFRDVTEETSVKEHEQLQLKALQLTCQLTNSSYFIYDFKTRANIGGYKFENFWPSVDGEVLPEEVFVYNDDLSEFFRQRNRLISGENQEMSLEYRSNYFGEMRYYKILAVLSSYNESKCILGVVQDITESKTRELKDSENENFIEMLLTLLPVPLALKEISNDYRFVMCNQAFANLFNKISEKIIGKSDFDLFDDRALAEKFRMTDVRVNASNYVNVIEEEIVDFTGLKRYFQSIKIPYNTKNGKRMLLLLAVDISSLKIANAKEQERRQIYEAVLDNIPAAISIKDASNNFRYYYWNSILEEQTGYAAKRVIGKSFDDISPFLTNVEYMQQTDIEVAKLNFAKVYDIETQTAIGKTINYHFYKQLIDVNSKCVVMNFGLDVTKEKNMAIEREKLIKNQQEMLTDSQIVNNCLRRIPLETDYNNMVNVILEAIGTNAKADYCGIYHLSDSCSHFDVNYEWYAPEHKPFGVELKHIECELFSEWLTELRSKRYYACNEVCADRNLSEQVRTVLMENDLKSMLWCGIFEGNQMIGFIVIAYTKDWHNFSKINIKTAQNIINVLKLARERKNQFDALRESTTLQKCILDTISIPILMVDANYKIKHASSALCDLFGVNKKDLDSCNCFDKFCMKTVPDATCPVAETLRTGKIQKFEIRYNERDFQVTSIPHWHNGKIAHILECYVDITEMNRSQSLLKKAVEDAEEAAQAKSLFLATMSHELRTPLNAIIGFADLLELGDADAQFTQESIHAIHLSASTLLDLINDILDLSKLEAGQLQIVPEKMDIERFLYDLRAMFDAKLKENNLSGINRINSNVPYLYLDVLRLRQVMLNIIGNAVKFTHSGGVSVEVDFVEVTDSYGTLTIQVKDSGIGISPGFIERIFEPFSQDLKTNKGQKGTGLGLSICKRLIEQMNGDITIQSRVGQGSCFTITLPNVAFEHGDKVTKPIEKKALCKVNAKALIIDDVAMNLKVLRSMLNRMNIEVEEALSGSDGLKKITNWEPDIIFTDLWMPEMNGAEFATAVKEMLPNKNITIVAVTADRELDIHIRDVFNDTLSKPVTIDKLNLIIEKYFGDV